MQSNRQTIRLEYQREIFPGYDADLCIWYPDSESSGDAGEEKAGMKPFELDNGMLHHDIDYTPYEGMTFKNWPRYTILRGKVVWDRDGGGLWGSSEMGST